MDLLSRMAEEATFKPFPFLSNRHLMTIVPALLWRNGRGFKQDSVDRLFQVAPHSRVLARCHFDDKERQRPTLIIVHGLESSSEAPYVVGLASQALARGMNVVRMNLRNCGDTIHLSPTLYNAGLSADVISVASELKERDDVEQIFLAGFSLGGNIVLKAAAELESRGCELLAGVCAVSPSLDLPVCVEALEQGFNRIYEQRFPFSLKQKISDKQKIFPGLFDVSKLKTIKTIRQFDDLYTAPDAGYSNAREYYEKASALPILGNAEVPILIIAAQDDPIVPFSSFASVNLRARNLTLLAPKHGGHGGFLSSTTEDGKSGQDRFWAENRVVDFCLSH